MCHEKSWKAHWGSSVSMFNCSLMPVLSLGHDCCETVKVLLCASREGLPVLVVAEEDFRFVHDEACDAAQFLATSAGNQQALNFTRFLDRSGPPSRDVNSLDEKVALAFRHLKLPAEWNVLGTDHTLHGETSQAYRLLALGSLCFKQPLWFQPPQWPSKQESLHRVCSSSRSIARAAWHSAVHLD